MENFEQRVLQFIEQQQLLEGSKKIMIACSGGMDSMALLTFFERYQKIADFEVVVAHVDHMLRGEQSAMDRQFVEDFCERHGLTCFSKAIAIGNIVAQQGGNVQAICREERYRFFAEIMVQHQLDTLVTAHHADDQLESILMALTKAGTIQGMQGIQMDRPFANGRVIRPFLMITKDEIGEYLQSRRVGFREDPSNAKDMYTRNRFRQQLLPFLKKENGLVSQHATQFSLQLAQDDRYLQQLAYQVFDRLVKENTENCYELEITLFLKEHVALQRRLILILLNYIYNEPNTFQSHTLCASILKLCQTQNGSAELHLPKAFIVRRAYGKLFFQREQQKMPIASKELVVNKWEAYLGVHVYVGKSSQLIDVTHGITQLYFNVKDVALPLYLRTRLEGDRIQLAGMQTPKRLSRLFIDEKVPLHQRNQWPLLVDANGEILAVLGLRVSSKLSKHKRIGDDYLFITEQMAD